MLKKIICVLLFGTSLNAIASEPNSVAVKQIREAARDAKEAYESAGLAGLTVASQYCYEGRAPDFYCVDFDVAAAYLDRRFADAMGINRYDYFDAAQLLERARPIFAHAHWSKDASNQYLQFADSVAREEIGGAEKP